MLPEIITGISKPKPINCLPSCRFQDNYNQMSNAPYPQKQIFFYQKTFCDVASHVLQVTCQENIGGYRRFFIEKSHPNICNVLEDFDKFFGSNSTCNEWPKNFFEDLEEESPEKKGCCTKMFINCPCFLFPLLNK